VVNLYTNDSVGTMVSMDSLIGFCPGYKGMRNWVGFGKTAATMASPAKDNF
jgi:hypothetical protein